MKTRVLLVDDEAVFHELLAHRFKKQPDVEIVGAALTGREAITLVEQKKPDVVLMDIGMRDGNGIDATREIHRRAPKVRIIALTVHAENERILAMVQAGASGYLDKGCSVAEILSAIRAVAKRADRGGQGQPLKVKY